MNILYYNQVKDIVDKELKFDSSGSLSAKTVKYTLPVVTISLRLDKILDINWSQVKHAIGTAEPLTQW